MCVALFASYNQGGHNFLKVLENKYAFFQDLESPGKQNRALKLWNLGVSVL